jgi:glycogen debranching enzyme
VTLDIGALCTWRDGYGERQAGGDPSITPTADGFVFEGAHRVAGPGFRHHLEGTRFGIRVDDDGPITHGANGWALTWMDARVEGRPITHRAGKPVEVNALWIDGLAAAATIARSVGNDPAPFTRLHERAQVSFEQRCPANGAGWLEVVDSAHGDQRRPNQLVAAAVLGSTVTPADRLGVLAAVDPLRTSLGLRSLDPGDAAYIGRHRGSPAARDVAYHQGSVWPWLLGPLVDVSVASGRCVEAQRVVDDAAPHVSEWGLGSVSETADGDAPYDATGCPFQAWSVAEWLRARRVAS